VAKKKHLPFVISHFSFFIIAEAASDVVAISAPSLEEEVAFANVAAVKPRPEDSEFGSGDNKK
jgi:hypothetical protein